MVFVHLSQELLQMSHEVLYNFVKEQDSFWWSFIGIYDVKIFKITLKSNI